jgi:hypothetical protein
MFKYAGNGSNYISSGKNGIPITLTGRVLSSSDLEKLFDILDLLRLTQC